MLKTLSLKQKQKSKALPLSCCLSPLNPLPLFLSHSHRQPSCLHFHFPSSGITNHLHVTNFHGSFLCLSLQTFLLWFHSWNAPFLSFCVTTPSQASSPLQPFLLGPFMGHFSSIGSLNVMYVRFSFLRPMVSSLYFQPTFLLPPVTIRTVASINNSLSVSQTLKPQILRFK